MPFDLTALNAYAVENSDILITAAVTQSRTAALIVAEGNLLTGIKTSEKIADMDTDVVLQDGDLCGFNSSGTTKITQRELVVGSVKVNEDLCLKELNKKYTQLKMQGGASPEALPAPLEQVYVDQKAAKIEEKNEKLIWQGDRSLTGDANLKWMDGFLKLLDTSVGAVVANAKRGVGTITAATSGTGVTGVGTTFSSSVGVGDKIYAGNKIIGTVLTVNSTTSITLTANATNAATGIAFTIVPASVAASTYYTNLVGVDLTTIIGAVKSVYMTIPTAVLDTESNKYIFIGSDWARLHLQALSDANLINYKVEGTELKEGYYLPGANVKVFPTPGLSGTNRMVGADVKNMWLGTDLENEYEDFDLWYSKDQDVLKYKAAWRIGVQWGFPNEVSQFLLAQ